MTELFHYSELSLSRNCDDNSPHCSQSYNKHYGVDKQTASKIKTIHSTADHAFVTSTHMYFPNNVNLFIHSFKIRPKSTIQFGDRWCVYVHNVYVGCQKGSLSISYSRFWYALNCRQSGHVSVMQHSFNKMVGRIAVNSNQ